MVRPVESRSGARGNILAGPQTFSRGPSGEKIFDFFFNMVHSGVLYISGRRRRHSNVAGPAIAYPLPHPLDGPVYDMPIVRYCG